jgi:hypothetical protein
MGILHPSAEQLGVVGVNPGAFPRPGNPHVKTLLRNGGERLRRGDDQDLIDGLALGGVGGDGVAVGKRAIVGREGAAVGERDPLAVDGLHGDALAVDEARRVGAEEEHVAGRDKEVAFLADLE